MKLLKNDSISFMLSTLDLYDTVKASNGLLVPLQETHQDTTYIVTPYNCSAERSRDESTTVKDFLEAIYGFKFETRYLFYFTISIFVFMLYFFRRCTNRVNPMARRYMDYGHTVNGRFRPLPVRHDRRYMKGGRKKCEGCFLSVLRYIYGQPLLKSSANSTRILIFSLSMFQFFMIVSIFRDSIESGQLNMYVPKVFRSFEDIARDEDVIVTYRSTNSIKNILKSAPKGSVGHKLYEKAKRKGYENGTSWTKISNEVAKIPVQNVVTIGSTHEVSNLRLILCQSTAENGSCYFASPNHEMSAVHGLVASKSFSESQMFPKFKKSMRQVFEMGILTDGILHRISAYGKVSPAIADCVSDSRFPVTHLPQVKPFGLQNYKVSLIIAITSLVIAVIVLQNERRKIKI